MTTVKPSLASRSAIAAPMPCDAPVIMATLLLEIVFLLLVCGPAFLSGGRDQVGQAEAIPRVPQVPEPYPALAFAAAAPMSIIMTPRRYHRPTAVSRRALIVKTQPIDLGLR